MVKHQVKRRVPVVWFGPSLVHSDGCSVYSAKIIRSVMDLAKELQSVDGAFHSQFKQEVKVTRYRGFLWEDSTLFEKVQNPQIWLYLCNNVLRLPTLIG